MIGICVLTIGIVLGSLGITNSIHSLQNAILLRDMRCDLEKMKNQLKKI